MHLKSLIHFKLIYLFIFLIIGIYFFYHGYEIIDKLNPNLNPEQINTKKNIKKEINSKKININNKKLVSHKKSLIENKNLKDSQFEEILIIVKKNDTFSKIIDPFFKNNKIKNQLIDKIKNEINLNHLNIGQKIYIYLGEKKEIKKIVFPIDFIKNLIAKIDLDSIEIIKKTNTISKELHSKSFIISSSLYQDGIKAGMPIDILTDAIRLYSFDIDFQRDIQKNTKFEISYEILHNKERNEINYGDIQFITLSILNKKIEYFIYNTNEGVKDYFNREGKNVKKSLLKTPIDGARLSSNFGMRKHPILGYNKLHKGVDFSAPNGTPIFAGGSGVIEYIGKNGGYGKYIRIRHNNEYKTAYAHLSGYKKNISKGQRVNQGDIIGYVGSTGKSTGPHLHYEIIFQNKQINPMKLELPSGKILEGLELKTFKKNIKKIYANYLFNLYE